VPFACVTGSVTSRETVPTTFPAESVSVPVRVPVPASCPPLGDEAVERELTGERADAAERVRERAGDRQRQIGSAATTALPSGHCNGRHGGEGRHDNRKSGGDQLQLIPHMYLVMRRPRVQGRLRPVERRRVANASQGPGGKGRLQAFMFPSASVGYMRREPSIPLGRRKCLPPRIGTAPIDERRRQMATDVARTRDRTFTARPVRTATETKPFFLTSEFGVLALMTIAVFIASAVVDDLDSRLAWILGSSMVGAYILSRGIAKAGTKSWSYDPREDMVDDGSKQASTHIRIRD